MQIHADFNNEASKVQQEDDGIMGTMDGIGYDRSDRPAQGNDKEAYPPLFVWKVWGKNRIMEEAPTNARCSSCFQRTKVCAILSALM